MASCLASVIEHIFLDHPSLSICSHYTLDITQNNQLDTWHLSEYDPAYQTPCFSDASLMHLQSSSTYSDTLHIGLCMLHNSTPPPASVPLHVLPLLVCLFVSPSGLFPLIDGQWTSAKSNCTCSIRRGLSRRLRSSLLLNSSPRCDPPCRIVY